MTNKWIEYFFQIASVVSENSKDPSTKVGCVVVDSHKRILATGYNGFPRNVADMKERYNDRPIKYKFVVHAEANAICMAASSGVNLSNSIIFITSIPCIECAKLIIQAGIKHVHYLRDVKQEMVRKKSLSADQKDWNEEARLFSIKILREANVSIVEHVKNEK